MASPQRPASPFKPHPLQFVSPQKANESTTSGPPKPARTYTDIEDERAFTAEVKAVEDDEEDCEVVFNIANKKVQEDVKTDTASRRSILEKRNLFEDKVPIDSSADPAMLPISQRKALFERNKSVPKPIARFGESVTPAMLSRYALKKCCRG